eukprot:jgi/Tetstr1/462886/TSEL_007835.t1
MCCYDPGHRLQAYSLRLMAYPGAVPAPAPAAPPPPPAAVLEYYGRAVEELRNGLLILERTEAADYNAVWRTVGRTLGGLRHVGADFHRDMGLLGLHIEAKEKQEHQRAAAATQHDGKHKKRAKRHRPS